MTFAFPAPLIAGDWLAVVAPSSPFRHDDLWRGLAWVRMRYRVHMSPGALLRDGYLAGTDARRSAELSRAMVDDGADGAKAILAARGGYGVTRIAHELPWAEFARNPRWIVGHSDITALHAMAWRAGVASIHGPNATGLGVSLPPAVRAAFISSLERPLAGRVWRGLRVLCGGEARGVLVGGNLAVLHALAAAGQLWIPDGAVLALEDVTERPYRIDRMLTSLLVGGILSRASAIVFGGFERCDPGEDGRTVDDVLEERTRMLGIPVVSGAPFGHGQHNEAFVLGVPTHVAGDQVRLGGSAS